MLTYIYILLIEHKLIKFQYTYAFSSNAERACSREFPSQSQGTFKQRDITEFVQFSIWLIGQEIFLFEQIFDIHDEPARLCPNRSDYGTNLTAQFSVSSNDCL